MAEGNSEFGTVRCASASLRGNSIFAKKVPLERRAVGNLHHEITEGPPGIVSPDNQSNPAMISFMAIFKSETAATRISVASAKLAPHVTQHANTSRRI